MTTRSRSESERERRLLKRYGITNDEYERLLLVREGCCWVCGKKPSGRRLHVDHDHKKKGRASIRGLVCWACNSMLQRGRDDPAILRSAADYLESAKAQEVLDATT